jgi:hypothetical protein|nr:hypothetical protein [uncultured Mediterranean phage uvMED]
MSDLRVTNLRGRTSGSSPTLPDGVVVTGVATATSFSGNLTGNATGLSGTPNIVVGVVTATSFEGDGSGLSGVSQGNDITSCLFT